MKNNLHSNTLLFKMVFLFACFMLVIIYNKSRAAVLPAKLGTCKQMPAPQSGQTNMVQLDLTTGVEQSLPPASK